MNILYFSWGENSTLDAIDAFLSMGHTVQKMQAVIQNYLSCPEITAALDTELSTNPYDFIFSFNYLPFLSETAQNHHIKYISWIYDCPHWTLYSKTLPNPCNYIFLFDRNMADTAKSLGAAHAYHLPLACNTSRVTQLLGMQQRILPQQYSNEISFVGSLYENNHYNQIKYLPDSLRGYLDGIMAAQKQLWGYNIIGGLLTPPTISSLQKYIQIASEPSCPIPPHKLFQDMILAKITSDERIQYINTLAETVPVTLYSGSSKTLCPAAANKGTLSYLEQVPAVYHETKINLNITLRSITSGIPMRAIDIMGCGGFLLTNYQPELAEYFVPGQEFVYFESLHDFIQKATYYLSHDQEREAIAQAGFEKVQQEFSYERQINKLLERSF